jgi:hypothetical protein
MTAILMCNKPHSLAVPQAQAERRVSTVYNSKERSPLLFTRAASICQEPDSTSLKRRLKFQVRVSLHTPVF